MILPSSHHPIVPSSSQLPASQPPSLPASRPPPASPAADPLDRWGGGSGNETVTLAASTGK
eukprot:1682925-Rhodomonas_salina.1